MSEVERLYLTNSLKYKYSDDIVKFLNDAVFNKYEIVKNSNIGDNHIYISSGNIYKFSKNFELVLQQMGFCNMIYTHTSINYYKPKLELNDEIYMICGYFNGKTNFGGIETIIPEFHEFKNLFNLIILRKPISNFTCREVYKCGVSADYFIQDYIKISCYNELCSRKIPTSAYYALKLLKFIKSDVQTKWKPQIDFITEKMEINYKISHREQRKIHKIIKYLSGVQSYTANNVIHLDCTRLHDHDTYSFGYNSEMRDIISKNYCRSDRSLNSILYKMVPEPIVCESPALSENFIMHYYMYSSTPRDLKKFDNFNYTTYSYCHKFHEDEFYGKAHEESLEKYIEIFNYAYIYGSRYIMITVYENCLKKYITATKVLAYFTVLIE